jgi:cytochrome bd ubiquinol oxidase subunit II
VGLVVLRADARALFDDLVGGTALAAVLASGAAGLATLALVRAGRYEPARVSAAVAVAAIIAGWGLAQQPDLLPGLTIEQAAAGRATLVALLVSIAVGLVVLIPSLGLLFGLLLRGRFDESPDLAAPSGGRAAAGRPLLPLAAGLLIAGAPLALLGEGVVLGAGIVALVAFVVVGALALLHPGRLAEDEEVAGIHG